MSVQSSSIDQSLPGPILFKLVYRIASRLHFGVLDVVLPDGRTARFTGQEETHVTAKIIVHDYAFARKVLLGGDIGLYESFSDGDWDTPDLTTCLYIFARNADHIQDAFGASPVIGWIEKVRHFLNRNTPSGSKRNIAAHYDLGNLFYQKWLDPTMTYSSAVFADDTQSLKDAQENKYRQLARRIDLKPGDSVLEIGSGWGGFAEFAAREVDAKVTGLTISKAQLDFAQQRIFKAGLNEKVDFQLTDYRDSTGTYDKVASIEMFEAVGKEYWPNYFAKIRQSLKPGGVAGLQVISIADDMYDNYGKSVDFIQRYVFPGGYLPSPEVLKLQVESAGLQWVESTSFGLDYARTLNEWRQRFMHAWDEISPLGFDERFQKLWRYYLAYCEAGFRAGTTDVHQLSIRNS